tara:strand:- start:344 stop:466 length:123 start_codon:yes stop_codon:yes gene_type:complete
MVVRVAATPAETMTAAEVRKATPVSNEAAPEVLCSRLREG